MTNITWDKIGKDLVKGYKKGKDANQGGLSANVKGYENYLMGFYLNARVAINPETESVVKVEVV